jgi:hypothetical protein
VVNARGWRCGRCPGLRRGRSADACLQVGVAGGVLDGVGADESDVEVVRLGVGEGLLDEGAGDALAAEHGRHFDVLDGEPGLAVGAGVDGAGEGAGVAAGVLQGEAVGVGFGHGVRLDA